MKSNMRRWLHSAWSTFREEAAAVTIAMIVAMTGCGAHSQKLTILHTFTLDRSQGNMPEAALALDRSTGALFGTTFYGGELRCNPSMGCGDIFELGPSTMQQPKSFQQIYAFQVGGEGTHPFRGLVIDRDGDLYGTTATGGLEGCGADLSADRHRHLREGRLRVALRPQDPDHRG
jgi:hypothetical protein